MKDREVALLFFAVTVGLLMIGLTLFRVDQLSEWALRCPAPVSSGRIPK